MREITLSDPREIDLEPEDVGPAAIGQLADALRELSNLIDPTTVQTRSSYQSRLLRNEPELPASELAVRWEESYAAGALARSAGAIRLAGQLLSAAKNDLEGT